MARGPPAGTVNHLWPSLLSRLIGGEPLRAEDTRSAMGAIMDGEATPAQIAAFVVALRAKGETPEEIAGLAEAMLERARRVETPGPVLDTCGTGGDRAGTFNVSTIAAIVAAGAGAVVAKHGNRAATSRCGSADLLEALGVRIDLDPEGVSRCLERAGIGFMFAPVFHAATARAAAPRRELGIPTVFNFLGPLTNPARPAFQVVGCADPAMLPRLAEVLAGRNTRAMVFRGDDGLDELTTTTTSTVREVLSGEVLSFTLDPSQLHLPAAEPGSLAGGDAAHNAGMAKAVLQGGPGPARDVVLLNAAAALYVGGMARSMEEGLHVAAESIDAGRAADALTRWVEASNAA